MARYVVRTNPTESISDAEVGRRFDRCVTAVRARGQVDDPNAVAKTMRSAYGEQFQRLSARGRHRAAKQRHRLGLVRSSTARRRNNPVQEIVQTNRVAPGHTVLEWIDVDDGQWIAAEQLNGQRASRLRRPPFRPGHHLVAPGAQLHLIQHGGQVHAEFAEVLFVKIKHHWSYLGTGMEPVRVQLDRSGATKSIVGRKLSGKAAFILESMVQYLRYEAAEHRVGVSGQASRTR